MSDVSKQVEEVLAKVDELGEPKLMSKKDFVEFCEELISGIETRKEAVEDELDDEEDGDDDEEDDEDDEDE